MTAQARHYEIFVDIETEEDLYELFEDGQIDQDTFETLRDLYQRGVDLNTASGAEIYLLPNLTQDQVDGILGYRTESGWIADPADLVAAGVLDERELLAIAPFLVFGERQRSLLSAKGFVRLGGRWSPDDDEVPPVMLRARVSMLRNVTIGLAATLTRDRLGNVRHDANRDTLSAEPTSPRIAVPKLYVAWESGELAAIAGSYRIGFGQRLTFDNSRHYTPNGIYRDDEITRDTDLTRACKESTGELGASPCGGTARYVYETPDYNWSDALFGVAAGLKERPVLDGHYQLYGFFSYQPKSIYQYEIYNRGQCDDPLRDDDPGCGSPDVFNRGDDPLEPSGEFSFHTLPNMFAEMTAGGNFTYFANRRTHIGLTGYGSSVDWLTDGIDLDFQESSRLPYGGPFGAIGLDLAWGRDWADLFIELSHSFDSMPRDQMSNNEPIGGGGGPAAIARATATWPKREIEASARYYSSDFANPYARPIAAADELDGLRARDEMGARLRYRGVHAKRFDIRASIDVWSQLSTDELQALAYLRTDTDVSKALRLGLWAQYQQTISTDVVGDACFMLGESEGELGDPIPCGDRRLRLTGRGRVDISRNLGISTQLDLTIREDDTSSSEDSPEGADGTEQDVSAWITATIKATSDLRARVRARYRFEDISDNEHLEQSLWTYADVYYRIAKKNRVRLRYDLRIWLDERQSTLDRQPSPRALALARVGIAILTPFTPGRARLHGLSARESS